MVWYKYNIYLDEQPVWTCSETCQTRQKHSQRLFSNGSSAMPRYDYVYDDEYDDDPRRRGDRSPSPPQTRSRNIPREEHRPRPSQGDTRPSTLSDTVSFSTAPSSALSTITGGQSSSSTAATAASDPHRHHRSSCVGYPWYDPRAYIDDHSQLGKGKGGAQALIGIEGARG